MEYRIDPYLSELGVDIEAASATYKQLIRRYSQGELNVPQDVQDLVLLCQSYRLDGLQHKYRCARLVEYILHLHFMLLARGRLEDLPPIPPDITWYVHTDRSGHRGQSNG